MYTIEKIKAIDDHLDEKTGGLLEFLSRVSSEVEKFDRATGFEVQYLVPPPVDIDGDTRLINKVGFVIIRNNYLFSDRKYCMYSVLKDMILFGYIGMYKDGKIKTLKELKPIMDFTKGKMAIYNWLRELIKESCGK
jgi:hypothetical protein